MYVVQSHLIHTQKSHVRVHRTAGSLQTKDTHVFLYTRQLHLSADAPIITYRSRIKRLNLNH
jgi:hypothetical protein